MMYISWHRPEALETLEIAPKIIFYYLWRVGGIDKVFRQLSKTAALLNREFFCKIFLKVEHYTKLYIIIHL